jgi:hypothetical protein
LEIQARDDNRRRNKKAYDPRSYLALAEAAMADRVKQAVSDLRGAGTTLTKAIMATIFTKLRLTRITRSSLVLASITTRSTGIYTASRTSRRIR